MRPSSILPLAIAALSVAPAAHAFQCYALFDAKNTRVYQTAAAPIDLSRSISDEMAKRFPSRYLVISDAGSCPEINPVSTAAASQLLSSRADADFSGTSAAATTASPYEAPAPAREFRRAPGGRR